MMNRIPSRKLGQEAGDALGDRDPRTALPGGSGPSPRHLAIIPDGNRRWAQRRGLTAPCGHAQGFLVTTPPLLEAIWQHGVRHTTLWMFSTDNWQRPKEELDPLMVIYERFLELLVPLTRRHDIRVCHRGRSDRLPMALGRRLAMTLAACSSGRRGTLQLALDYGGRDELVRTVRSLVAAGVAADDIDETRLAAELDNRSSYGRPEMEPGDPDLILRTSGEQRLSGFMPWQSCHSELFFPSTLYPDLSDVELRRILAAYGERQRRYGR
ncbi:MAG: polyprenyl diphosphate synthase [Acidobacteriota bacterium]